MLTLDSKITVINKIGEALAGKLARLDIRTIGDMLFYFPFRYESFSEVSDLSGLKADTKANITGRIILIQNRKSAKKRMNITEALVANESGEIKLVWFNQPFIARSLRVGDLVSLAGKIENSFGSLVMKSPSWEKAGLAGPIHTKGLVPVYSLTADITQKQLRFLMAQAVKLAPITNDWLPEEIVKKNRLLSLPIALKKIHFPENFKDIEAAQKRLGFNELFLLTLKSQISKNELGNARARAIGFQKEISKKYVNSLPFRLTDAQKKAAWEILKDLEKNQPMARLLEGDVGSGKTVVASLAILNAAENRVQSALMVPTEILAKQHFESLSRLYRKERLKIALLTRSYRETNSRTGGSDKKKPSKKYLLGLIADGKIDLVVGTHALIQEQLAFPRLGLAIIDEQHRFGVDQRNQLMEKSLDRENLPHLLSMTATPIPRTLALTLYGDLNISLIDELPKNRKPIITKVVPEEKREEAYSFIRKEIKSGRQAFVVCPLIDLSDKLGVSSVKEEFKKLSEGIFPEFKTAMLHGKLKTAEKEEIMQSFALGETNILVSTSVIEVGIDIPNATIMMIESAERFGLAQLHQFRGRVGRGDNQSYCFLLSGSDSESSLNRLKTMERTNNGFDLAKADLKFRGPGEVFGTAQKGFPDLKIANLFDYPLVKLARDEAEMLVKTDPGLSKYPELKSKIGLEKAYNLTRS